MGRKTFIPRQRDKRGGHKGPTLRDKRTAAEAEQRLAEALYATTADERPTER